MTASGPRESRSAQGNSPTVPQPSDTNNNERIEETTTTTSRPVAVPLTTNALLACLAASLGCMSAGTVVAYTSPAVSSINSDPGPFHLTVQQTTWVGSVYALGAAVGAIIAGPLMDGIGRKLTMMITALPSVVGWLVVVSSGNPAALCGGRALTGLGRGLLMSSTHVYIAEVAPPDKRGLLLGAAAVAGVLGNLYEYVLGYFLGWTWLAVSSAVLPVLMLFLMVAFVPESPRYLLLRGEGRRARQVLDWLREGSSCVTDEMAEILEAPEEAIRGVRLPLPRPLAVTLGVFTVQQLCGNTALRVYSAAIFAATASCGAPDPGVMSIVMGLVGVAGTMSSSVLLDHLGRRKLLLASCASMAVCSGASGAYFQLRAAGGQLAEAAEGVSWIPAVSLIVSNLSYSLAFDPVPWILASELFGSRTRGRANSICGVWQGACSFLAVKFLPDLWDALDGYGVFWLSAAVCVLGLLLVGWTVPETKRMTLESIGKKYSGRDRKDPTPRSTTTTTTTV